MGYASKMELCNKLGGLGSSYERPNVSIPSIPSIPAEGLRVKLSVKLSVNWNDS
jgi:hypothetical protein